MFLRCPICRRGLTPSVSQPYAPICSEACRREALRRAGVADPEPQPPAAEPQAQFEALHATHLYCRPCQRSMPTKERLLLALPTGDLYGYTCAHCGSDVGTRTATQGAS
jgi:hypothetical protein